MEAAKAEKKSGGATNTSVIGFAPQERPSSLRMVQHGELGKQAQQAATSEKVLALLQEGVSVATFVPDEKFAAGWSGSGTFETRVLTCDMKLTFLKLFPPNLDQMDSAKKRKLVQWVNTTRLHEIAVEERAMKLLDIIKLHHDAVHKENVLVVVFNHERGITRSNVWVFQVTKGKQHELKDALKNIMHQSPHQTETENAAASVLQGKIRQNQLKKSTRSGAVTEIRTIESDVNAFLTDLAHDKAHIEVIMSDQIQGSNVRVFILHGLKDMEQIEGDVETFVEKHAMSTPEKYWLRDVVQDLVSLREMYFEERMVPVIESCVLAPPEGIATTHQHLRLLLDKCFQIMLEDDAAFDAAARSLHCSVLQSCRLEAVMAKHSIQRTSYMYGPLSMTGDIPMDSPVATTAAHAAEAGEHSLEAHTSGDAATGQKPRGCDEQCGSRSGPCRQQ